jgi:hypothetical protein
LHFPMDLHYDCTTHFQQHDSNQVHFYFLY